MNTKKKISIVATLGAVLLGLIACAQIPTDTPFKPINFSPLITSDLVATAHVMEGRQVELIIAVNGTPPFTYLWYKNDTLLGSAATDTFLALGTVQLSHAGKYSVIVKNEYGADTSTGTLIVDSLFYKIAVSKSGKGTISPTDTSGYIKVRPGATPTFTYAPDSGSHVDSVFITKVNVPAYTTASSYTFGPITIDNSFRVVFSGTKYILTVTPPVNGTILPTYTSKDFDYNDTATLTAVPNTGFYFGGWGDDASGTDSILRIVMKSNKSVSANFTDANKFSLTTTSPNGIVELNPPGGSYSRDLIVQLTAKATAGYRFLSWGDSASASGSTNPTSITMNTKKVVKANFTPLTYQLTVTASTGGTVTTPAISPISIDSGSAQTILATAQTGYTFVKWDTISGTPTIAAGTNRSTTVTLTNGNAAIKAIFAANGYMLAIQKNNPLDTTYPSGSASVIHGAATDILIKPYRGTHFTGWTTVSGTVTFADSLLSTTTVSLTNGNATIKAKTVNDTFTLAVTKDSGTVAQLPASQTAFIYGDTIKLIATPKTGYHFTGWSGDTAIGDTLIASIKVTFTKSRVIHAGFAKIGNFAVNVTSVGGAFVKSPSLSSYEYNDKVALTATPDSAHTFTNWIGDIPTTSANPCTVMVTATKNITANYAVKKFALTMNNGGNGTTTPAGIDSITLNTQKPITVAEASGYRFVSWTVTPANAATIQNPTSKTNATVTLVAAQAITVKANYIKQFAVSVNRNPVAGGAVSSDTLVDTATYANLRCFDSGGYTFSNWQITGSGDITNATSRTTTVLPTGNITVQANFDRVYRITYTGNGSDGGMVPVDTAKYKQSAPVTLLPKGTLLRTGYEFLGWSLVENGDVISTFTMGAFDTTVFAKWTQQYTITYNLNNGTQQTSPPPVTTYTTVSSPITLPTPTRSGYGFAGWFDNSSFGGSAVPSVISTGSTGNKVFYAKWVPPYIVTFDDQGADLVHVYPSSITVIYPVTTVGSLPTTAPQKTGQTFAGWSMSPLLGQGTAFSAGMTITADDTVYAMWTPKQYKVIYRDNINNPGIIDSTIANYGSTFTLRWVGSLTKTDYQFAGWNTKADGSGTSYDSNAVYTIGARNDTLFAKWAALTDKDGNRYTTVRIGAQTWMVENLKTTNYRDGTPIAKETAPAMWGAFTASSDSGKYCWYDNDSTNKNTYGALYNWYTVDPLNPNKIGPVGWHTPTRAEWNSLQNYLIANGYNWDNNPTGNKIAKSMAVKTGWSSSVTNGSIGNNPQTNNSSGFSGVPSGYRDNSGSFLPAGQNGYFWEIPQSDNYGAYYWLLAAANENLYTGSAPKMYGFSIRLIRD